MALHLYASILIVVCVQFGCNARLSGPGEDAADESGAMADTRETQTDAAAPTDLQTADVADGEGVSDTAADSALADTVMADSAMADTAMTDTAMTDTAMVDVGGPPSTTCTMFIAPNGSDADSGRDINSPKKTIGNALTGLDARGKGETVCLRGGDYHNGSSHRIERARGDADHYIYVVPYQDEEPVFRVTDPRDCGISVSAESAYIHIYGIEIAGPAESMSGPMYVDDGPCSTGVTVGDNGQSYVGGREGAHNVILERMNVHHMPGGGIVGWHGNNVSIIDNVIHHNAYWLTNQTSGISMATMDDFGAGADAGGYNNYIVGNYVYANENKVTEQYAGQAPHDRITDGNCIILDWNNFDGGPSYQGKTLVEDNVCFDNGGAGLHAFRSANIVFRNNTTFHNGRTSCDTGGVYHNWVGEISAYESSNITHENNIAIENPNCGAPSIINGGETANWIIRNNVFVNEDGTDDVNTNDGNVVLPSAADLLQHFSTDPSQLDWHVVPGSIADQMNAGAGQ